MCEKEEEAVTRFSIAIATVVALLAVAPTAMAAPAGPQLAKCAKHKQGLGNKSRAGKRQALRRFGRCLAQNKANRIAYGQIRDSNFDGIRGDGQEVDWTFCSNGRWTSRITSRSGSGVSEGRWWRIKAAIVRQGGRWVDAIVAGQGGYEVALRRRGARWQVGISSFDRVTDPGDAVKSDAHRECATL